MDFVSENEPHAFILQNLKQFEICLLVLLMFQCKCFSLLLKIISNHASKYNYIFYSDKKQSSKLFGSPSSFV